MPILTLGLRDRRNKCGGSRRWVGRVLLTSVGKKTEVVAEAYGESLEIMRRRKWAIYEALKPMEDPRSRRWKLEDGLP